MSRILNYLDGSKLIKILALLKLDLIIIFTNIFSSTLFGTRAELYGQFIKDTRPLNVCTLFLSLLVKHFICAFCLLWSKVKSIIIVNLWYTIHISSPTGATSYEDLRTVSGHLHENFKEACCANGLLQDDREWLLCLQESANFKTGYQLHHLFIVILIHCAPVDPHHLWEASKYHLCDDLAHQLTHTFYIIKSNEEQIYDYRLHLIDQELRKHNKSL